MPRDWLIRVSSVFRVASLIWLPEPYQSLDSGILSPGIKQKGKSRPFHLLQSYSDNTFDV